MPALARLLRRLVPGAAIAGICVLAAIAGAQGPSLPGGPDQPPPAARQPAPTPSPAPSPPSAPAPSAPAPSAPTPSTPIPEAQEPSGPTPEELAAERQRAAELARQRRLAAARARREAIEARRDVGAEVAAAVPEALDAVDRASERALVGIAPGVASAPLPPSSDEGGGLRPLAVAAAFALLAAAGALILRLLRTTRASTGRPVVGVSHVVLEYRGEIAVGVIAFMATALVAYLIINPATFAP